MSLVDKKCKPCEGGIPRLTQVEIAALQLSIHTDWEVIAEKTLRRSMRCVNFAHAMDFANKIAVLADEEDHHPDLHVSYGRLDIEIWTHAIGGLSENDFILAAKIDRLV